MRSLAFIPIVLSAVALILSFLCLFAGSSRSFMQDYAVVTLNTSRFGENLLNASHHSSNPFLNAIDGLLNSIEKELNEDANDLAQALGLRDFYSAHILDYCEGFYVPGPVANATLKASAIHQNVTFCSNRTTGYEFDPTTILQRQLNASGHSNVNLTELQWPHEITEGLHALRDLQRAVFALYCVGIGFTFLAFVLAVVGLFMWGRASAFGNVVVDFLAFLALGIASALVTAVAVKAAHLINHYGSHVGVSAQRGNKFLALTWVATGVMFVASLVWCFECVVGRRRERQYPSKPKYG